MQEDIDNKVLALSVRTGEVGARMTASMLRAAMNKYLSGRRSKATSKPGHKVGRQSVKSLMKQNTGLSDIKISDGNIGSFKRIAGKYGIDYSLKKDKTSELPHYIVFFKARDVDVMTQAFKEYTSTVLDKDKKPSIRKKLENFMEKAKVINRQREKVRQKTRGLNR